MHVVVASEVKMDVGNTTANLPVFTADLEGAILWNGDENVLTPRTELCRRYRSEVAGHGGDHLVGLKRYIARVN